MNNFRSVTFWKEAIMTLPDNAFFELLRTVFGKIKTPFNKQILAGDLEQFLARNDIQNHIAGYIDTHDARIIAAVAALNEPVQSDLEIFFTGELNRSEVHDLVINLEERFILYRFFEKEDSPGRLALNPALKSILSPFAADRSLLFPSVSVDEVPDAPQSEHSPLNDRIFAALLSFVSQNRTFFKPGGMIRQKAANTAKTLFPDFTKAGLQLETIIGGLRVLGLFFADGETLTPDHNRFAAFGLVSRQERLVYCAAGILCYTNYTEGTTTTAFSPWLFRTKVIEYAHKITHLYNSLDPQRLYPQSTLQKMAYMQANNGKIIDAMEKTGLIVPVETYWQKASITECSPSNENVVIAMDTPFTLLVYPEIAYNDVVSLAAFSTVIEAGMTVRFELSRDSAVTAFNRGFSAIEIIALLQRLSHNRISENVSFTLSDWEKRHGEVTLRRAVVLTLSPEQRHLAQTAPLAKLITETPAPGIYLLPESKEEKAIESLHKAGVAIIARREEAGNDVPGHGESSSGHLHHFFPELRPEKPHPHAAQTHDPPKYSPSPALTASTLTERFRSILDKMRLGKEERDELSARIDRRLVLCESQLKDAVVRYEKLEARGLDYVGKAMIAKQAISLQSPVEVTWTGKQKQERAFGIPKALEKSGSESILVIDPLNEGDTIRLSLGKISLLRRIKKSIFEGS
jgi:DNA-binding MarR family transcriptional regulator